MKYDEIEEKTCAFNKYLSQTMDLLKDAHKWKVMAEQCDEVMKSKYMAVSDTLFNLFMTEHNNIGQMFKNETK